MANAAACSTSQRCWSDLETATLIGSWGRHYLDRNRGNLQITDWQDVANVINFVHPSPNTHWTPFQCRNRVDELRERFESEKAKIERSNGVLTSSWRFYTKVEHLFGTTNAPLNTRVVGTGKRRTSSGGLKGLAEAIEGFAKVYERVENLKVEQMVELEKRRMAFAKDLEKQRRLMLVDMLDKTRAKRVKRGGGSNDVTLEEFLHRERGGSDSDMQITHNQRQHA